MKTYNLHLVSDSTGETVLTIAKACVVQFEGVEVTEHTWSMVRTKGHLAKIFPEIETHPGMVLFTLLDSSLRAELQAFCRKIKVPCISVLDPFIAAFGSYLGVESQGLPGRQHVMDADYFDRIDAMNFVMTHDDGQSTGDLKDAQVILVGVSRTSKTPTCVYLANRGIKAANVPIVPTSPLPDNLVNATNAFIIGLTEDPVRLVQIRRNRLRMLEADPDTEYTDLESIKQEIAAARRLFNKQGWPVIDVTRRSIEETAAAVMQLLAQRDRDQEAGA
jgi:regulator of PEP synthase PpsR (kinase-PPPase family)